MPGTCHTVIAIDIPGFGKLELARLVLDYNGTLAVDGKLLSGVVDRLRELSGQLEIHVITADTFGVAKAELAGLPLTVAVLPVEDQAEAKRAFVSGLGADKVVAVGNGRNDCLMLAAAVLGIAVIQDEGAAAVTLANADVAARSVSDALDLLRHPKRLVATLRS